MTETMNILGVRVSVTNLDLAARHINECIRLKKRTYICVAPVSTIVDCQNDPEYLNLINNAELTTPDGMPLVWIGKMKGKKIERTYGPDLMRHVCDLGQAKGYRHYLYGGSPLTLERLRSRLKDQYPQINIVGSYSPPLVEIHAMEKPEVIDRINRARPDILWVGLGSPKQDYWMKDHRPKLNVPVMVGVGAAFDFLASTKRQAPVWMRRSGLEWLFRLGSEPRRLWRRYLIGNSRFIMYLVKDAVQKKAVKKS